MNNYCTNCGKKLDYGALMCKECNTPIVALPNNYKYISPQRQARTKKILTIIGACILCVIVILCIVAIVRKIKIDKMRKQYVEPYLRENYSGLSYSIDYDTSGECVISASCTLEGCKRYEYLDKKECKAYYYSVKNGTKEFVMTVVNRNNHFYVVEGKNIYGRDKGKNETEIERIQKECIEPYLKENYDYLVYSIEFDSYGKCVTSGNCYRDPVMGCDGGACSEYEYLDYRECESYHYYIKALEREFLLTAVNRNNEFYVVEGKNIYGKDKKEEDKIDDAQNDEDNYNSYESAESGNIIY